MNRTTIQRTIAAAVGVAALAIAAAPSVAGPSQPSGSELARVRAATARYHDVAVALADGYIPVSPCEQSPDGVMGVHYLQPDLAADAVIDPTRPELLLYVPGEDGDRLVGVEYFVAAAATGGARPEVFGVPFDGPMAGHSPGMPEHYDLHVWTWRHNPDGTTAQWNPALTCPV